jgi:hypothetical protein
MLSPLPLDLTGDVLEPFPRWTPLPLAGVSERGVEPLARGVTEPLAARGACTVVLAAFFCCCCVAMPLPGVLVMDGMYDACRELGGLLSDPSVPSPSAVWAVVSDES